MKKFLAENWIIIIIGIALMGSMTMAIRNNYIIQNNNILQKQSEMVHQLTQDILSSTMHGLDLGVRGFGLTKEPGMLNPYDKAIKNSEKIFFQLDSLLEIQHYNSRSKLKEVETEVHEYIDFSKQLISMAEIDSMNTFIAMLKEDRGLGVWKKYDGFSKPLLVYETNLNNQALANYNFAIQSNLFLQISIIVFALPALFMFVRHVRRERDARHLLVKEVEENDKRYVFNSGSTEVLTAKQINDLSINNSRQASRFIKSLASGKYEITWEGLNENNISINKETVAGNLTELREHLQTVKREDEQRNSANEGLAQFSEIVRANQNDTKVLTDKCLSFLIHKVGAQQGSIFNLDGEKNDTHLNRISCYAFNRKKHTEKRIELGQGLVGQAFLEGQVVQLKHVPQGYTTITSGLGESTPSHLLIVPLKNDVQIVGILEVACLKIFEQHQIDFLKKAGEFLASAILNTQTTYKMKDLLEQAMMNEEKMRASEEEMRQNMEELMATQEELVRQGKEMQYQTR